MRRMHAIVVAIAISCILKGVADKGTAAAKAEALTGIAAMKSTIIMAVFLAEDMMTRSAIMEVGAEGTGVQNLINADDEVEVLGEGEIEAQSGKAGRRDVLELLNGTGRKNSSNNLQNRSKLIVTTILVEKLIMNVSKMVTRINEPEARGISY